MADCEEQKAPTQQSASGITEIYNIDMDDVRTYKITLGLSDGSFRVYDEDSAFWGTLEQAIRMSLMSAQGHATNGKTVTLIEVREID